MQDERDKLETGLRQIPPAPPPPELMARLRAATAAMPAGRPVSPRPFNWPDFLTSWRGLLVGASAAAVMISLAWLALRPAAELPGIKSSASLADKADTVQVGHSLLASFDTVAQLPGGEPVRFRCREWQDDVVIHDDAQGVVISKSTPRVEVVPVRFETY